ncbi:MAG: dipeptidase [bacterium]|jgi:membrane dipeptidase
MSTIAQAEKAKAAIIHRQALVWDNHCDTLIDVTLGKRKLGAKCTGGHIDLPRLQEGGVNVQVFAIYIASPPFLRQALEFISAFYQELAANENLALITSVKQIPQLSTQKKIGALLSIEGGEVLEGGPGILPCLYQLGVRAMGLTWNWRNQLADGVAEAGTGGGLTTLGIETIKEMNRLGMVIDVSHLSPAGFWDVLAHSEMPFIASHSNARKICDHPRNLDDGQIKALAAQGGIMGINFAPDFLGANADLNTVIDHIDYIANLTGSTDCIALGSDYDGIPATPVGLEDVSCLPNLTAGLVARGYQEADITKILGGNSLRVFQEVIG